MKTVIFIVSLIIIVLIGIYGWKWIRVLTASSFDEMLAALYKKSVPLIRPKAIKSLEEYVVLDARSEKEYAVSCLQNAQFIGYESPKLELMDSIAKDQAILVYCSVGYRSERIGEQLQALGFSNVQNLYGGIFEWVNTKHTVVSPNQQPTDKVHGYSESWGKWVDASVPVVYD